MVLYNMRNRMIATAGSAIASIPVSYTHLDVYKRQPLSLCSGADEPLSASGKAKD